MKTKRLLSFIVALALGIQVTGFTGQNRLLKVIALDESADTGETTSEDVSTTTTAATTTTTSTPTTAQVHTNGTLFFQDTGTTQVKVLGFTDEGKESIENDKILTIPAHVRNDIGVLYYVKEVSTNAFMNDAHICSLFVNNGVKYLDRTSFMGCDNLRDVSLPSSIVWMDYGVFWDTPWLTETRNATPDGLVYVNKMLVDGYKATGDVVIKDGITDLISMAFSGNDEYIYDANKDLKGSELTSVVVPDTVDFMGPGVFRLCKKLERAKLSSSLTKLNGNTFQYCESLKEVEIPDSITSFGSYEFYGCKSLESINLPESLVSIKANSLPQNQGLVINIPASWNSTRVTNLRLDKLQGVQFGIAYGSELEDYMKENDLPYEIIKGTEPTTTEVTTTEATTTEVTTTETTTTEATTTETTTTEATTTETTTTEVTTTEVTTTEATTTEATTTEATTAEATTAEANTEEPPFIGPPEEPTTTEVAVAKPTTEVTGAVTTEGKIIDVSSATTATDVAATEKTLKVGTTKYVKNVGYVIKSKTEVCYSVNKNKNAKSLEISSTIRLAGKTYKVTSVGKNACNGMKKLKKLKIPNSVKKIESGAFANCKNLKTVMIGTGVTKIGKNAFKGDQKITTVQIKSKKLISVGKGAFKGVPADATIKVPKSKLKKYRSMIKKAL